MPSHSPMKTKSARCTAVRRHKAPLLQAFSGNRNSALKGERFLLILDILSKKTLFFFCFSLHRSGGFGSARLTNNTSWPPFRVTACKKKEKKTSSFNTKVTIYLS